MLSPLFIVVLMILAYVASAWILKHRSILYTGIWFVLALVVLLKDKPFMLPFVKGYVGFAFFYVVMITGALPQTWKLTLKLKSVRAPYSILGFILLMAHPLFYALEVLQGQREIPLPGIIAFVIMIPLFVTSYMKIRVKMKAKTWKKLQQAAYVSYAFILLHLIVQASTPINRILAVALFAIYAIFKIRSLLIPNPKKP